MRKRGNRGGGRLPAASGPGLDNGRGPWCAVRPRVDCRGGVSLAGRGAV